MKQMKGFTAAVALAVAVLGGGASAFGEEGTVRAVSPWKGEGYVFPVGEDTAYMVAVYTGTLFVDDGKGPCTRPRSCARARRKEISKR